MNQPLAILRKLVAPLHTPIGIVGALLLVVQLARAIIEIGDAFTLLREVWPSLWGVITSPLGTFATVAAGLLLYVLGGRSRVNENDSPPLVVTTSSPSLQKSLYIGEIRFGFGDLEKDRHSEVTLRVFNGSGGVVELLGLSGHIKFNAPNNKDLARMGTLPPPTLRADTARLVPQLEEWFLILDQRVPAAEADKLLAMLAADAPIHFDLSDLSLLIGVKGGNLPAERLPLWSGFSYRKGYGFGRIMSASIHLVAQTARVGPS